ncbi:MAG: hypothetical protein NTV62_00910 [Candidatus Gribaldobacteria bacterium]|nr:hypothetical protein [Candidatus Gribaldobacteria bacterium]
MAFTNLMEVLSKNLNNNRLESLLKQESAFDEPLKIDNLIKKLKNLTESLKNQKLSGKESQIYEDYKESESIKKYLQSKLSKLPRQS